VLVIKVSLIFTVRNEEETIDYLLDSIAIQSRIPDEIVVVDGGSSDSTVEIIKRYIDKLPIELIVCPNVNIAQGRNIAIRKAKHDIICATDAGCYLKSNWLSRIMKPLEEEFNLDVVSGVYAPWYKNDFEKIASNLFFPNIETLKAATFLPSARSVLFKKSAWAAIGGFPEQLDTAEDTVFDLKLRRIGMKFGIAKDAIVYWRMRETVYDILKQFYKYAKSEGLIFLYPERYLARYVTLIILILMGAFFWNNPMFYFLILMFGFIGLWMKYLKKIEKISPKALIIGTATALAIETGLVVGYGHGILMFIARRFRSFRK
jgi:glycosyltransferase involved in cell wall biosynthesis